MERVSQNVISGNYFNNNLLATLNGFAVKLQSDVAIIVDNEEHNAKRLHSLLSKDPIRVGQTIRIVCYHDDIKTALSDLDKMREFVENDIRGAD